MNESLYEFYSSPQYGSGSMASFEGTRRQSGGSFLGTIMRFAMPILKSIGHHVLGIASNTASDVISNRKDFKTSLRDNTLKEMSSVVTKRKQPNDVFTGRQKRRRKYKQ